MTGEIRRFLARLNISIIKHSTLLKINSEIEHLKGRRVEDLAFLCSLPKAHLSRLLPLMEQTPSQLKQDLFVLSATDFKTGGYFVEFGATDGVTLSNSLMLERCYGWRGILAEPAKCWQAALRQNRTVAIDDRCVWVCAISCGKGHQAVTA